jgi:nucleotide-binding universal stress UspA family protein
MKKLFKKILLPLQLEKDEPDTEIKIARDLAKRDGSKVILMHIVPMMATGDTPLPVEYYKRKEAEALKALDKVARRSFGKVKTDSVVLCGDPAEGILSEARKNDIGAIVMATHGRRGLKHLLLGSVAERVVREAHCPVIAIPPEAPQAKPAS